MSDSSHTGSLLADLSVDAANLVHGENGDTAYSYHVDGRNTPTPTLAIDLAGADPYSYTDCNGWVNFALNSASPIHAAVLTASKDQAAFTVPGFTDGVNDTGHAATFAGIDESQEPFARAFVLAHDFAAEPVVGSAAAADTDGFAQVADFGALQAGDVIAYATGIYSNLTDEALPITGDTGHTMVVTGAAVKLADAAQLALAQDEIGPNDPDDPVAAIYAVPIVDSSDVAHVAGVEGLGADDRPTVPGGTSGDPTYTFTSGEQAETILPFKDLMAGGLGTGTMWFAVDANGRPLGFRFNDNANGSWHPTAKTGDAPAEGALITAGRLQETVDLGQLPASSLVNNKLAVTLMANRAETLGGRSYLEDERVTGQGGLLVNGTGTLTLGTANDFKGGIELQGVGLRLEAAGAAGSGAVTSDAGTTNTIAIDAGSATLALGGDDTVSAASGGSTVEGGRTLQFTGAAGANTVMGGSGSATITGGGGGVYLGGSDGHNAILGTGGRSLLWGGGAGDLLVGGAGDTLGSAGMGNSTLVGGTGGTVVDADGTTAFAGAGATVFGAASGSDTVSGAGDFTLVGRGGNTTLFEGTGTVTAWAGNSTLLDVAASGTGTLVAGSGASTLWIGVGAGAQRILAVDGAGGGTVTVNGFRVGTDSFSAVGHGGAASSSVSGGSLTVVMADHTSVTFAGVTSLG